MEIMGADCPCRRWLQVPVGCVQHSARAPIRLSDALETRNSENPTSALVSIRNVCEDEQQECQIRADEQAESEGHCARSGGWSGLTAYCVLPSRQGACRPLPETRTPF